MVNETPYSTVNTHRDSRQPAERIVSGFLLVVLHLFAAFFLYHAVLTLLYPYTIDYGEGFILDHGNELANFRNPYQSIEEPPWVVVNYPPVYPSLIGLGIRMFGIQLQFGRALSLI